MDQPSVLDQVKSSGFASMIGKKFEVPPTFDDPLDERLHRKQRLAAALRLFGRLGYAEGVAGHITARDPIHTDHFWVNPLGMNFRHVSVSDLILVNDQGQVVEGEWPVNAAAFAIHSAIHEARPDVVAAAHTHSIYGKAFSALGKTIDMLSQDACMFYDDVALHVDGGGAIVMEKESGQKLAQTLGAKKAVIHQNHGLITVGTSVDAAAWWYMALERCCQAQLLAEAAGPTIKVPDEYAQFTYQGSGAQLVGWFQFQPHYQEIARLEPDLFD